MHVPNRVRFAVPFGTLLVGLIAGLTFGFAGSGSDNAAQARVVVGRRIFGNDCTDGSEPYCSRVTREFSFFAVLDGQGGSAHGTVTYGNLEFGGTAYVLVTCLAVEDNEAEIGGTIVRSPELPSQVGYAFHTFGPRFRRAGLDCTPRRRPDLRRAFAGRSDLRRPV